MVTLCYHRISHRQSVPTLGVSDDTSLERFEAHLRYFRRHFRIPRLTEPFDLPALLRRRGDPPTLLLTFDDGYREMREAVLPLLVRHNVRAVFFVTTDALDGETLWFHQLAQALRLTRRLPRATLAQRRAALRRHLGRLRRQSPAGVARGVQTLIRQLGVPPEGTRPPLYLTWDDAAALQRAGMILGFHARAHTNWAAMAPAQLGAELRQGRARMAACLGAPPDLAAYPFGRAGFVNEAVAREVARSGFRYAFTVQLGEATQQTNPLALPRLLVEPQRPLRHLLDRIRLVQSGACDDGDSAPLVG